MLLVIDIGNTDIVFGFYAENTWKAILRTPTHQPWSPLRLQMWLVRELKEKGFESYQPDSILISSVVPSVLPQIQKGVDFWSGKKSICMGTELYSKLPIDVISPDEIGSDLVANSVYAHVNYKTDVLIVDFGTALTFTLVDAKGKM